MKQKLLNTLPSIDDVIIKIKNLQELTADEELVYLLHIEKLPEDKAREIVEKTYEHSKNNQS